MTIEHDPAAIAKAAAPLIPRVRAYREADERRISAPDIRKRLQIVADAAAALARELDDHDVRVFVKGMGDEAFPLEGLGAHLGRLSEQAQGAADRVRRGSGPGVVAPAHRGGPPKYVSAREIAALAIFEAWREAYGEPPGVGNVKAWDDASALWGQAGGTSGESWRKAFEAARDIESRSQEFAHLRWEIATCIRTRRLLG